MRAQKLRDWVVDAAERANVELSEVKGGYDSAEGIVREIFRRIENADIVVVVVREVNANVFFEAGYAIGWGRPVLYVARNNEQIPFDIRNIERFTYSELDSESGENLTEAMLRCMKTAAEHAFLTTNLKDMRQHLAALTIGRDLYGQCVRHALEKLSKWVCSWSDASCEFMGAPEILEIGTFILDQLTVGGFATLYYRGQKSWEPDGDPTTPDEYFEATRRAVKRLRSAKGPSVHPITRVYVVEKPSQTLEDAFRKSVWADVAADLNVRYILKENLPAPPAQDFGIWDDKLVAEVNYSQPLGSPPRLFRCTYFKDKSHLDQAREWRDVILHHSKPVLDFPAEQVLLEKSEREASECADYCKSTARGKSDCSNYHLPWQRLRRCHLVSTPRWHADFYGPALRDWTKRVSMLPEDRRFTILITGLADYGMLYWAAQSIAHAIRQRCTFHVLDICETPLKACHWLKRELGERNPPLELDLETHAADVFDNRLREKYFDVILSDAFLTRFPDVEAKANLMSEWSRLIRPGGTILTTARIREGLHDIEASDRDAFVVRARERAAASKLNLLEIEALAKAYAAYIRSHPFDSETELRSFLRKASPELEIFKLKSRLLESREMMKANYARIELRAKA